MGIFTFINLLKNCYLPAAFIAVTFFSPLNTQATDLRGNHDACFILSRVDQLIEEHPDSALIWINKGLQVSEREKDFYRQGVFYMRKGAAVQRIHPDTTLKYYFMAMDIMKTHNYPRGLVSVYTQIGSALGVRQPEKQMEFYRKALNLASELGIPEDLSQIYANMGGIFIMQGDLDSATIYLHQSLEEAESVNYLRTIAAAKGLMAEVHIRKKEYSKAKPLLLEALRIGPKNVSVWMRQSIIEAYLHLDQPDSAKYHFDIIRDKLHLKPAIQSYTYHVWAEYYKRTGNFQDALTYREKADSVKMAMDEKSTKNMISVLELESAAKLQKAEMEKLNAELDKANLIRVFLLALLLIAIVFIYQQRQKNKRTKEAILLKKYNVETKQELLEAELKNSEIQKQYLSDELKYTNKELMSFATNITQSQTLINDLKSEIGDISKERDGRKMRERLREMKVMLAQTYNNDKQREEFMRKSRQLNHSLVFYLKTNYPQLTEGDTNLLVLLLLKFSSKEIAALYNIELVSAKKRRYRVRKKLGLETEKSWEDFFDQVLAELELKITG